MLGVKLREELKKPLNKVGLLIAKTGINPNVFSFVAFLWAVLASYFIANRDMISGLVFLILVAIWDSLDGSLARVSHRVTKFGNYLDAMIDRYIEIIIVLGFAFAGFLIESFLVVSGSLLVSYAKARTALVIPIDNREWPAIGESVDRFLLLVIGMVTSIFLSDIAIFGFRISTISLTLYVIAAIVFIGSIQRIFYAKRLIGKI